MAQGTFHTHRDYVNICSLEEDGKGLLIGKNKEGDLLISAYTYEVEHHSNTNKKFTGESLMVPKVFIPYLAGIFQGQLADMYRKCSENLPLQTS